MNDAAREIQVSIICNAYNHEKYIRDALEGFVMQKTNFAFEVLIHDDASTDKTADIIREYEAKYPDLIKPIYQAENQYSKGIGAPSIFQRPRVTGRYVAFCEGDDYWTDPLKLQKQYDAMEAHPEIDMCACAATRINALTDQVMGTICPADRDTVFRAEEVILGGGGFVASASLFYRTSLYQNEPEFRKFLKLDYTLQMQGSLRGGLLYLADYMSAYRVMSEGSWSERMRKDQEKARKHFEKVQRMLDLLNEDTDGRYESVIRDKQLTYEFQSHLSTGRYKDVLDQRFRALFKQLSAKNRIVIRLKAAFPFVLKIKKALRGRQA